MSGSFRDASDYSVDVDQLLQIGLMCKQLKQEKDMLRESFLHDHSENAEEIRRLEYDVKTLTDARSEDKKYIAELERELRNCSQEIGYLQDQLNLRNVEANCVAEHVHCLELKLTEVQKLTDQNNFLGEELRKYDSEHLFLIQALEKKETQLQKSNLQIEKLMTTLSYMALDSQCEIEGVKLDLVAMENMYFEAESFKAEAADAKVMMDKQIIELQTSAESSQKIISCLEKENKELQDKLEKSEKNNKKLCQNIEAHLDEWMERKRGSGFSGWGADVFEHHLCYKLENKLSVSEQTCTCEDVLGPLLSKLAVVTASDEKLVEDMDRMSHQIHELELLVKQLKDELKYEKSKAKEEADDLTQEMAELRYQIMDMLEQESKRRACFEQASVQRIEELEAQVRKEQKKSFIAIRQLLEVQKLAKEGYTEFQHFDNLQVVLQPSKAPPVISQEVEDCSCGESVTLRYSINSLKEDMMDGEANCNGDDINQLVVGLAAKLTN